MAPFMPWALAAMARPTPVLPAVGSMMVLRPGLIWPSASAARIMPTPMRSFTLPPGLRYSSLEKSWKSGAKRVRRSRGVFPTRSRTVSTTGGRKFVTGSTFHHDAHQLAAGRQDYFHNFLARQVGLGLGAGERGLSALIFARVGRHDDAAAYLAVHLHHHEHLVGFQILRICLGPGGLHAETPILKLVLELAPELLRQMRRHW